MFQMKECDGTVTNTTSSKHCFTSSYFVLAANELGLLGPTKIEFCDIFIYNLAYWTIITKWILIGCCLLIAVAIVVASSVSKWCKEDDEQGSTHSNQEDTPVQLTSINEAT